MHKYSSKSTDDLNTTQAIKELVKFTETNDLWQLDRARILCALAQNFELEKQIGIVIRSQDQVQAAKDLLIKVKQ